MLDIFVKQAPALDISVDGESTEGNARLKIKFAEFDTPDRMNDIIRKGAIGEQRVPFARFGHNRNLPPIGVGTAYEDGDAAVWEGELFMKMNDAEEAYYSIKGLGSDAEFSWGFSAPDKRKTARPGAYRKGIDFVKTQIFEVCQVFKGAGRDTRVLAQELKSFHYPSLAEMAVECQTCGDAETLQKRIDELTTERDGLAIKAERLLQWNKKLTGGE